MALICPGCRTVYEEPLEVCPKDNLPLIVRTPTSIVMHQGEAEQVDLPDVGTFLSPGIVVGEYRIETPISASDMGSTYAAIHPLIRKRVAIRVLHKRYAQDPRAVSRFVMEARAVNEIGHHNIVDILSIGELWDGRNYLVMELLDGISLQGLLTREKRLKSGMLVPVFEQICDALNAAHAAGFVHRDLKPENVVILRRPPRPFVKIQDFGLAKLRGNDMREADVATLVGTPVYMAPEHSQSGEIDSRVDIYSLGVMLFEMLTGRPPYPANTLLEAFAAKVDPGPPRSPDLTALGAELEQVVFTAMAWAPEDRYPSVLAFWDALNRAVPDRLPWSVEMAPLTLAHLSGGGRTDPTPAGKRAPVPEPFEAPPARQVLAPETIVGDVQENELKSEPASPKMIQRPGRPAGQQVPPPLQPEVALDEEPTDIFCGTEKLEPADLLPGESLGSPLEDELSGEDTELSEPPFPPPGRIPEVTVRRVVGSSTLLGVGPPSDTLADTRPSLVALDMEPEDTEEPRDHRTTPSPTEPGVESALAPEPVPGTQPETDDPYCSFEVIGELPGQQSQSGGADGNNPQSDRGEE